MKTKNKVMYKDTEKYKDIQKVRVKIANLVARNKEIDRSCCICGKPGNIYHNKKDPYYISFICTNCRKDINNRIIAEEQRVDIRTKLDKTNTNISNFTDEEIKRIVIGFMNDNISKGQYCKKSGLSRYQFNKIVEKYNVMFPKHNIIQAIHNHTNKIKSNQSLLQNKEIL